MTYRFDQILRGGAAVLIALLLSACQMYSSKDDGARKSEPAAESMSGKAQYADDSDHDHYRRTATFERDEKLGLIPINKGGKKFESCGTLNHNDCALFHHKIKLDRLEPIIFVDYQINPHCQIIIIGNRVYYDPDNPHCPNYQP